MNKTFKIVAFLEGVSYILLLFIAVPIKYWADEPKWVGILGMPHGILFILYILLSLILKYPKTWNMLGQHINLKINIDKAPKWDFKDLSIILFASILPFGTFYVDRKYMKDSLISSKA
ncbi:MAG: hypothetical protein CMD02_03235 [Flavobacteriales bacterium]|nr:hypothetical protein [Flavobacteriales bacterium]MAO71508.1 hypothetical protein [Flavobacteriales bacterium]|tara:strand:- start:1520 stop:1873 length:354 start_codon:yes stop_codon:yes gene_type:complete